MNIEKVRRVIDDMAPEDGIEYLLDLCKELGVPSGRLNLYPAPGLRLSPHQASITHTLDRHHGEVVHVDTILAALYADDLYDRPVGAEESLRVKLAHLRQKLAPHGVVIRNVWGCGYRITKPASFEFDWT